MIADAIAAAVRRCRECGCTDVDCTQCIEKTGAPCWWVSADLCSRCATELEAKAIIMGTVFRQNPLTSPLFHADGCTCPDCKP